MTIEPYTEVRREEVLGLMRTFYKEMLAQFGQPYDEKVVNASIDKFKSHSFLLIIGGKCVGVFAGIESSTPLSNQRIFQQAVWYIKEEFRHLSIPFIKRVMKTLKELGYDDVVITLLPDKEYERRAEFFEKLQFKPLEYHWIRSL